MSIETEFPRRLKLLRTEKGMSLEELADKVGTSKMTLSRYENGSRSPKMSLVNEIANYFQVDISWLSGISDKRDVAHNYMMFDTPVAAGTLESVEPSTTAKDVVLPDITLGKYAGDKDVFVVLINGESMNRIIPNHSLIAVKKVEDMENLKDDDIVVFSYDNESSVKRFFNDAKNERVIFSPDSKNREFTDIVIPYSECDRLKIIGKVVIYIVELD